MRYEPEHFSLETTSIWNFPMRGDWATHDGKYRGNWSPYIPRNLNFVPNASIDLICTHPPYADIIHYSDGIRGDISNCTVNEFLIQMESVSKECFRVLKRGKYCSILIGDIRKRGHVIPIGFDVMKIYEKVGFRIKEIIIKEQHNCQSTKTWKTKSAKHNFLLLAHEYIFIFKKR